MFVKENLGKHSNNQSTQIKLTVKSLKDAFMCVSVLIAHILGVFKGSQVNAIHQMALVILLLF